MWLCKRDLSKECEGKYRDCTDCVLDKIIADIGSALSEEVLDDNRQQISDVGIGLEIALRIIDKYKAKSGGKK